MQQAAGSGLQHSSQPLLPHLFVLVEPFVGQIAQVSNQAHPSIISFGPQESKSWAYTKAEEEHKESLDQPLDLLKLAETMSAAFSF